MMRSSDWYLSFLVADLIDHLLFHMAIGILLTEFVRPPHEFQVGSHLPPIQRTHKVHLASHSLPELIRQLVAFSCHRTPPGARCLSVSQGVLRHPAHSCPLPPRSRRSGAAE